MEIVLATANPGKLREVQAILAPRGIGVRSARDLGFDREIEETGATFAENAQLKASTVARALGIPALADDSGLVVEALEGRPGVYSARYAGPGAGDQENNRKLLQELAGVPPEKRGAAFVCVMACCKPNGGLLMAKGTLRGRIALAPAGSQGFGYDPVFELPELGRTVAQLRPQEKNSLSHRARALANLVGRLPAFLES